MDQLRRRLKKQGALLLVIAVFATIVAIVNPARELLTQDDGWAYARSVKHLLETGEYRLDSWAAANMPVQIYFAAGVARIFGYSLSTLRICTLLLYLGGAIAFYRLLCELGTSVGHAAALTLAFLCSPMVLWLGFTFMTDVQFLGWVSIACWLYARGLRSGSLMALFLGGLAAALGVGTRQFGVALPAGLVFAWIVAGPRNRVRVTAILAGIVMPAGAFLWQLSAAREHPTFTQSVRLIEQRIYLGQGALSFAWQALWRSAVLAEYTGLYLAAIIPGLLLLAYHRRTRSGKLISSGEAGSFYSVRAACFVGACLIAFHVYYGIQMPGPFLDRFRAALMPMTPWVIGFVMPKGTRYQFALTAAGIVSSVVLCGYLFRGSTLKTAWRKRDLVNAFFVGTACAFVVLHFLYVQFNDTYFIVFTPLVLIAIAQVLRAEDPASRSVPGIALCSALLGIAVAVAMRGDYNKQQAVWQACDRVHAIGVDVMQIRASTHWLEYHSAFDDWLAQLGPEARPEAYVGPYRLHDSFLGWLEGRQKDPAYIIYASDRPPSINGYDVTGSVPYRDRWLRQRFVYILKRPATLRNAAVEPVRPPL
jgi:4-amino-4-deoxy-L-arabinose transferase-like glycosyltransferase